MNSEILQKVFDILHNVLPLDWKKLVLYVGYSAGSYSMKYYISDLHLFHENAIKFDHRPFESVQEMHKAVLKNWNGRVTNGDFVYLLGDMSLRGKNEDLIAFVTRLKGKRC